MPKADALQTATSSPVELLEGLSIHTEMTVAVTTEQRLQLGPDGECYGGIAGTHVRQWRQIAGVFGSVNVLARAERVAEPSGPLVTTDGVRVVQVPPYQGMVAYARYRGQVLASVREALQDVSILIAVVPGNLGNLAVKESRKKEIPYAVAVVGDPWEVFARGASRHPLRAVLRRSFAAGMRRHCTEAVATRYVTERTLQERYPPPSGALTAAYSDVSLSPDGFAAEPRSYRGHRPLRLINVAMQEQPYKGIDVLLHALLELQEYLPCRLTLVGEGRLNLQLRRLAGHLGVLNCVIFSGSLSSTGEIRRYLDASDIFVLPSLTEGLPRALIEAMARGLPCVASDVGGVPELLASEDLVRPGSARELAAKVLEVSNDDVRMERMSVSNLARSQAFNEESLDAKAFAFLECVRNGLGQAR